MWWYYGLALTSILSVVIYMTYVTIALYCENNNNRLADWFYDKLGPLSKFISEDSGCPVFLLLPPFMIVGCLAWPVTVGVTCLSLFYYFVVYNKAVKVLNKINSMMENK